MDKQPVFDSPDAYVLSLSGWQRPRVEALRALARATPGVEERLKWGHLIYVGAAVGAGAGPVFLIRAEPSRMLLGFWRGQRLRHIEPRLAPGGKYEMATLVITETTPLDQAVARALVNEAVKLNLQLGDPTRL